MRLLCLFFLIYELSVIGYTGLTIMFPVFAFGYGGEQSIYQEMAEQQGRTFFPVYAYAQKRPVVAARKDSFEIYELGEEEILTMMELENSSPGNEIIFVEEAEKSEEAEAAEIPEQQPIQEIIEEPSGEFVKHDRQQVIELADLADYETLVKKFYTIDAITTIGADELNAEKLGNMDMTMKQTSDAPQILIYHTHSQEGFADSVPGDDSTTIMGVGEHLKEILEEEYGYNVIHHLGKYDVKTRDSAYSYSLPAVEQVLKENPTIEVVIDLHRDGVEDESYRLVTDLDGRPTAKFMFFNGISRTKSTGKINYLQNDNLQENLAFSFQMKRKAEEYYPGLTRKNYLNAYRYNMHICPKTLLIELGAQNNTLEEAMNACDPIAHILDMVLSGKD